MSKAQDTRVSNLEKRTGAGEVFGIQIDDEQLVNISGTDTVMSLEEFRRLYPDGVIINLVYVDVAVDEAIKERDKREQ